MYRHRGIPEHRLRPRCRHHHELIRPRNRILDVPQMSLPLFVHHFQIAQHRQTNRAPVHQPCLAVDQFLLVQPHKHFAYHPRHFRRKREFLPRPVAALPNLPHLLRDFSPTLFLPLPHAPFELLAPELPVINAFFRQFPHHHALRRNSRMVHSRQVERVVPAHPVPSRQDVNLRVVQHVPDVQRPGYVRGWNDNREYWSRSAGIRLEKRFLHPILSPARLNQLRFVRLCDLASHLRQFSSVAADLGPPPPNEFRTFRVIFDYTRGKAAASIRLWHRQVVSCLSIRRNLFLNW